MYGTPGKLIPEKQFCRTNPFQQYNNKILGALAIAAWW